MMNREAEAQVCSNRNRYRFGVTFSFSCPICRELSAEKAGINSPTNDPDELKQRLDRDEVLRCRHCHTTLPNGVNVAVEVIPGTLEYLKAAGFPFPPSI